MNEDSRVKRWREAKRQHGLKAVTLWLTAAEEMRLKDLALQAHCTPSAIMQHALAQFSPTPMQDISIPPDTSLIRQLIREELAQVPDRAPVSVPVTESTQLRQLIQDEVTGRQEQLTSAVIEQCLALITPNLSRLMEETVQAVYAQANAASLPPSPCAGAASVANSVTEDITVGPADTPAPLPSDDSAVRVAKAVTETVTEYSTDTVADNAPETAPVTEPSSQARTYGEVPAGVLAVLAERQAATAAELAKALGDSSKAGTKTVWQALQRLLKRGAVIRQGQQYRLPA